METYNFPDHFRNDTFDGVLFTVTVNGNPLDLTGVEILAQFKRGFDPPKTLISPIDITITNAEAGEFRIDAKRIDWFAGTYNYDITFTLLDGSTKTYIKGTWTILEGIYG